MVGRFTNYQDDLVAFDALIAKRQILLQWKSPKPLGTTYWVKDVMSFLHLEKNQTQSQGIHEEIEQNLGPLLIAHEPSNVNRH